jgi:hypothetical protein
VLTLNALPSKSSTTTSVALSQPWVGSLGSPGRADKTVAKKTSVMNLSMRTTPTSLSALQGCVAVDTRSEHAQWDLPC